jgi:hypothetical protein
MNQANDHIGNSVPATMKIIHEASGSALIPEKWAPRVRSINPDSNATTIMDDFWISNFKVLALSLLRFVELELI